jgi:signal peptidase I
VTEQEAPQEEKPATRPWWKKGWFRDLVKIVVLALVIFLAISYALETVRVDGSSMVGNLQSGDLLLTSKISFDFGGNPQRGDIVILLPPNGSTSDYIKRVVGLPGDVIEIDGSTLPPRILIKAGGKGALQVLKEPYLTAAWTTNDECCSSAGTASQSPQAYKIPAGSYFVMGDNRDFSMDSRSFGVVARKSIFAKAFLRIWPFGHFGGLGPNSSLGMVTVGAAMPGLGILGLEAWRRRKNQRPILNEELD